MKISLYIPTPEPDNKVSIEGYNKVVEILTNIGFEIGVKTKLGGLPMRHMTMDERKLDDES